MLTLTACPLCSQPLDESDLPEHIRADHDIPVPKRNMDQNWACSQCGHSVPATDWHWCRPVTPTLERRDRVMDKSHILSAFIDWLRDDQHYVIAQWVEETHDSVIEGAKPYVVTELVSARANPSDLLHAYFGIDAKAEERELRALLDWTRAQAATE